MFDENRLCLLDKKAKYPGGLTICGFNRLPKESLLLAKDLYNLQSDTRFNGIECARWSMRKPWKKESAP